MSLLISKRRLLTTAMIGRCYLSSTTTGTAAKPKSSGKIITNDRSNVLYAVVGGFAFTIFGGIKYMHEEVGGTEGLQRTFSFYKLAIPKYVEYRYHMFVKSPDSVWEDLDQRTSKLGLEKILELKGFYVKSGQMVAANIGDAFPKVWQETMSILQDQCPHKKFHEIKTIVENEYNKPLEQVFASFEETPIGAASIGQVHRATLKGTGEDVVVKIMYPEVEQLFRGDVRTIKMFAQLAQPVHVPALEEIEKQFMTEFDYQKEAYQLNQVRQNLVDAGIVPSLCAVPRPYLNLCTKRVLVMEELHGVKLADGLKQNATQVAMQVGVTTMEEMLQEVGAASASDYDVYIRWLDAKRRLWNLGFRLNNIMIAWWLPGSSWKQYDGPDSLPINHARMVDELMYIHGHEVLVDGYFNGDPHPGNLLLLGMKTGKPKLGLIDYGQVKRLPKDKRLLLCKIMIALADDDRPAVVRMIKEAGYKSKNMDDELIFKYAKVYLDEDSHEWTGGKHIQLFLEDLQAADPVIELPNDYIMVGRASLMLRGLAHALHQGRSVAKEWKPIAEKVLEQEQY